MLIAARDTRVQLTRADYLLALLVVVSTVLLTGSVAMPLGSTSWLLLFVFGLLAFLGVLVPLLRDARSDGSLHMHWVKSLFGRAKPQPIFEHFGNFTFAFAVMWIAVAATETSDKWTTLTLVLFGVALFLILVNLAYGFGSTLKLGRNMALRVLLAVFYLAALLFLVSGLYLEKQAAATAAKKTGTTISSTKKLVTDATKELEGLSRTTATLDTRLASEFEHLDGDLGNLETSLSTQATEALRRHGEAMSALSEITATTKRIQTEAEGNRQILVRTKTAAEQQLRQAIASRLQRVETLLKQARADVERQARANQAHRDRLIRLQERAKALPTGRPRSTPAVVRVTEEQIRDVQDYLNQNDYESGPVDGIVGPLTRAAIGRYQRDVGLARLADALDTERKATESR